MSKCVTSERRCEIWNLIHEEAAAAAAAAAAVVMAVVVVEGGLLQAVLKGKPALASDAPARRGKGETPANRSSIGGQISATRRERRQKERMSRRGSLQVGTDETSGQR